MALIKLGCIIRRPETAMQRDEHPAWVEEMDPLDEATGLLVLPISGSDTLYCLTEGSDGFVFNTSRFADLSLKDPEEDSDEYCYTLNTKWVEVVDFDPHLESTLISYGFVVKPKSTLGTITIETLSLLS